VKSFGRNISSKIAFLFEVLVVEEKLNLGHVHFDLSHLAVAIVSLCESYKRIYSVFCVTNFIITYVRGGSATKMGIAVFCI
jgi:hypothetical protein